MHWNHRVLRHLDDKISPSDPDVYYYTIHEVFFDGEEEKMSNVAWTVDAIAPMGEDINDLRETLERMLECLNKSVLEVKGETLAEIAVKTEDKKPKKKASG